MICVLLVEELVWFMSLCVGGILIKFKLDIGVEVNVLLFGVYLKFRNKLLLLEISVFFLLYGDFKVKFKGILNLNCEVCGMKENLLFFVVVVKLLLIFGFLVY